MASTINATTSSGIVATADNTGSLALQTSGTTAVTIDTSQNVGIGTTSPSTLGKLAVIGGAVVANGGGTVDPEFRLSGASAGVTRNYAMGTDSGQRLYWYDYTAADYRMLIDSSGNLLVGGTTNYSSTSTPKVYVYAGATTNNTIKTMTCGLLLNNAANADVSGYGVSMKFMMSGGGEVGKYAAIAGVGDGTYANQTALAFYTNPNGTNGTDNVTQRMFINGQGSIGAPSGTNIYNASDARLKKNINPIENGLDVITSLNPVSFNWIHNFCKEENDKLLYGFIAQEVQEVESTLVEPFGLNNAIYVEDKIIEDPLRVNEKFIIPYLVKAIQEQQELIKQLQADVAALKGAK